ncbi:MAG: nucleotide exchange factor GrpE [Lachnospiraceae bacterium]|nr:nucleotide exchange factor GrpE [Lachnospiraceae bacterium]
MSKETKKKVSDENFDTNDSVEEETEEKEVSEEETVKETEDIDEKASDSKDDSDEESEESDEESKQDDESSENKKSSKKDKKDKKSKHQAIIDDLNDRVMRQMAEFENFRKRTEKEKGQMYDMGAKSILEKILPVVDNFERGLDAATEGDSFADGMKMIYKQLMTSLEEAGVKEIEAEGSEFNPDYHNAVMHVEDEELGENVVAEVLQKGYMYNDTVLRHAMVKVAN